MSNLSKNDDRITRSKKSTVLRDSTNLLARETTEHGIKNSASKAHPKRHLSKESSSNSSKIQRSDGHEVKCSHNHTRDSITPKINNRKKSDGRDQQLSADTYLRQYDRFQENDSLFNTCQDYKIGKSASLDSHTSRGWSTSSSQMRVESNYLTNEKRLHRSNGIEIEDTYRSGYENENNALSQVENLSSEPSHKIDLSSVSSHEKFTTHTNNKHQQLNLINHDDGSIDEILRGPQKRPLIDSLGRLIVTKETMMRAYSSDVDNGSVLRAMLCCGTTTFALKFIDTPIIRGANSCDESELTMMSSDLDDNEGSPLQLPPGWKQVMSRSKNRPYYVHPDHGRTWYYPALLHKRKTGTSSKYHWDKRYAAPIIERTMLHTKSRQSVEGDASVEHTIDRNLDDQQKMDTDKNNKRESLETGPQCSSSLINPSKFTSQKENIRESQQFSQNIDSDMFTNICSPLLASSDIAGDRSLIPTNHSYNEANLPRVDENNEDMDIEDLDCKEADQSMADSRYSLCQHEDYILSHDGVQDWEQGDINALADNEDLDSESSESVNTITSRWITYACVPLCSLQYLDQLVNKDGHEKEEMANNVDSVHMKQENTTSKSTDTAPRSNRMFIC